MRGSSRTVRNHATASLVTIPCCIKLQWFVWILTVQLLDAFSFRTIATTRIPFISSSRSFSLSTSSVVVQGTTRRKNRRDTQLSMIYAPPGSGYARPEDEESTLPDSYVPMMEYPGTMRPGRTPENMPFHDLPIADSDPDPVPWPHFQEIEWHHKWDPPHPHPIPMEEFIEQQGRWATPEMEAAMRAGNRRDVRKRQELEDSKKRDTLIMDDDDDDIADAPQDLGDGMFGKLGSAASMAITAAATAPPVPGEEATDEAVGKDEEGGDDDGGDFDDFLLDLGLDADDDEGDDTSGAEDADAPVSVASKKAGLEDVIETFYDDEDEDDVEVGVPGATSGSEVTASISVDDDDDLDLGVDDEDEMTDDDGVSTVPLEDFGGNDSLDQEDFFDDGGFDYDDSDSGDWDGGDVW